GIRDLTVTGVQTCALPISQLTPAEFVERLNAQAGGPLSPAERDALVAGMLAGQETRASALRRVAEDEDFKRAELNRAFVLMQYRSEERRVGKECGTRWARE